MKIISYITFWDEDCISQTIYETIGKGNQFNSSDKMQVIELDTAKEDYKLFTSELKKKKIDFEERHTKVYSSEELLTAKFLKFVICNYWGYPQPENSYLEVCYDTASSCPKCHNGAKQINPLMLKGGGPKSGKSEIRRINWCFEYIITTRLADIIQQAKFSGCEIWPVIDYKTKKESPDWKQLYFSHEVPLMSKKTSFPVVSEDDEILKEFGIEKTSLCECGKFGRNIPDEIYYQKEDISKFCDFNKSHEWLGGGATTYQVTMVSSNVYKFLLEQEIKPLELFAPIHFEEQ